MPRYTCNQEGSKQVPCQACGMLFKQCGIATRLTFSKSCRDWVRTKHLKHNVNVLDSSIIDMVPFWEIVFPPSAMGQCTTPPGSDVIN
jgi:hypothetical protein